MLQVLHSRRMGRNRNKTSFILSVDALTPTCYPTANHIATPAKQPKLADFVVLRIPTGSLPSQTEFIPFVLRLDWIWMGDIVWCECFNSAARNYALNHLTWTQHERGFFIQGFNSCPRAAPWANMHLIASFHWLQRYLKFTLCSVWTHKKKSCLKWHNNYKHSQLQKCTDKLSRGWEPSDDLHFCIERFTVLHRSFSYFFNIN